MSDIITKGLSRLAYQFNGSENLRQFLQSFLDEFQNLENSGLQLLNERYLNEAVGAQLDGIGEIVGADRTVELIDIIGAFGFEDDDTSRGFGILSDPDIGGNFISIGENYALIGDDLYRTVIRAKIIKNQTAMTVDDTTRLISFMFDGIEVRYLLFENLKPIYSIGKIISPLELFLLDQIPLLIGLIDVTYYVSYNENAFSFAGDISGLGFGDINDPIVGGNFAKIIV